MRNIVLETSKFVQKIGLNYFVLSVVSISFNIFEGERGFFKVPNVPVIIVSKLISYLTS